MTSTAPGPDDRGWAADEPDAPLHLLVVEDSPSDAALVRAALLEGAAGWSEPRVASTLADAISVIAASAPDCVLLDLGLPDSDGLATLETVLNAAPTVAVIVFTGRDDEVLGRSAVRSGAQDYLVKGKTDGELLRRAVSYAICRSRAEQAVVSAEQARATAVRLSEERLLSLIANSSDVLSVVDASGGVIFASPASERILGHPPEALAGRSVLDFVHPEDAMEVGAKLEAVVGQLGVHPPITARISHAHGGWRWMEATLNNLLDDPSVNGIVANLRDVSDQQRASQELSLLNRVLRTVSDADAVVVRASSEAELIEHMCRVIVDTGGYAMAWIAQPDPLHPDRAVPRALFGTADGYHESVLAAYEGGPVADGPATHAMRTGTTQVLQDVTTLHPTSPLRAVSIAHGLRAQLALPLVVDGQVMGALSIHAHEPNAFDDQEVVLLEQLAVDLAYAIGSLRARATAERLITQMRDNLRALVSTMAATAEARDPYIAGHQARVARLASAIARELRVEEDVVAGIEVAASIHDVGKIAIPAEILSKPGRISRLEFELIKEHVQAGYDIIKGIDFPWPVARMVHEHHERLDGSGYPRGLQAGDLLQGSLIIAVADVVEAMASHRPYRPALGIETALAQIQADRGSLLDPDAVDACVHLFEQGFALLPTVGANGWAGPAAPVTGAR